MSYSNKINYLTKNILSDEWYTPDNVVRYIKENFNIHGTIICPYDTDTSSFVKFFPNSINNINDFLENDYSYDICITNPPFSLKEKVLQKLLTDKKEAILILPQTFLYSVTFYNLLKKYRFLYEIYIPRKRIYFYNKNGDLNRPNFHSIIFHLKSFDTLEFGKEKYIDI